MDPNLYHTIPGGIEAKVSDIIILLLNCFILGGLVAAYTAYRVYQTINEKKAKKSVTLGPMTHLADIAGDNLYQWKQSRDRTGQTKKKLFSKGSSAKPNSMGEEIVCKSCGLMIKTTTLSFN